MLKKSILVPLFLSGVLGLCALRAGRYEPHPEGPRYCKTDPSKSQVLFENGKVNFEIVSGKSSPAIHAARELAEVLGRALGVKLELRKQPSGKLPALIVGDEAAARAAGRSAARIS